MPIPDYQELMLPVLGLVAKRPNIANQVLVEELSNQYALTDDERRQVLPSGTQTIIANRVGWAKTYLKMAGLLISPKRGCISITEQGDQVLLSSPKRIDNQFLMKFDAFREFRQRRSPMCQTNRPTDICTPLETSTSDTPEEAMERIYQSYKDTLIGELLEKIQSCSFTFFEQLVVDLMLKLGYGGEHKDAGLTLGRTGDEGIDGVIREDRLGLARIYLQAKRWKSTNTVGRPEIQQFAGAFHSKSTKGVFITTSSFSAEARRYAESSPLNIILIDGRQLCDLMWEKNLGLDDVGGYRLKRLRLDYFTEE